MKEEYKTVREWLMMLKEPYRSEAMRNARKGKCNFGVMRTSLHSAILIAFDWEESNQSREYWNSISNSIWRGEDTYLEKQEGTSSNKTKPIPREVEVTFLGCWHKTELIADLSGLGVERPYVVRHPEQENETMMYSNIREIKKEPESFREFTYTKYAAQEFELDITFNTQELNETFTEYQEYLTQFDL